MTRSTFFKTLLGLAGVPFVKAKPHWFSNVWYPKIKSDVILYGPGIHIFHGPRSIGKATVIKGNTWYAPLNEITPSTLWKKLNSTDSPTS